MLTNWALPQYPLASARTRYKCVRLDRNTPWNVQDPGLGLGLLGKLWAFFCWAAATAGVHESQGWEWARLDKQQYLLAYMWTGLWGGVA